MKIPFREKEAKRRALFRRARVLGEFCKILIMSFILCVYKICKLVRGKIYFITNRLKVRIAEFETDLLNILKSNRVSLSAINW